MHTDNILSDIEIESAKKKIFYLLVCLFLLATIINCFYYLFPSLSKYPLSFHLKSFNSYFSVVIRIVLPIVGIIWFFQKQKKGWETLTFLTSFGISHIMFWMVRLLTIGGTLIVILNQVMTIILVILIATLYLLFKKEILEWYRPTARQKTYALLSGLLLAILFNLKIFFIG